MAVTSGVRWIRVRLTLLFWHRRCRTGNGADVAAQVVWVVKVWHHGDMSRYLSQSIPLLILVILGTRRPAMKKTFALLVLLVGCGAEPPAPYWPGDPDLYGIDLVIESSRSIVHDVVQGTAPRTRIKRVLELSCAYWGHDPSELAGMRIRIYSGLDDGAFGYWRAESNTLGSTTDYVDCIEQMYIPHELLHVFIGDPGHTSELWSDEQMAPLWEKLTWGTYEPRCYRPYDGAWSIHESGAGN